MKCLHISASVDVRLGGVSRSVIDLASALCRGSVDVTLAFTDVGSSFESISSFPLGLEICDLSSTRSFVSDVTGLIQSTDLVHLHTPWWTRNLQLVEIARRFDKPVILSSHGMLDDWSMKQKAFKKFLYMKIFGERMLRQCVVHCTAKSEMDQVLKRSSPLAVEVIPLIIDRGYFTRLPETETAHGKWPFLRDARRNKVLFLGRVDPKKGLDVAIRALAALTDAILVVAGPGDPRYVKQLKDLAIQIGVADQVFWLGSVYNEDKESLLAACDCMVLPTQQENFGLVLVEGLSMGMHVVTTKGTDIWEEIARCGGVIAERTPESFASAIATCLLDTTSLTERLEVQRKRLCEWLDPEVIVDSYVNMYKKHLGQV